MREPQEIQDAEYEQILERVCAIDVAKASGKVCTRVPHPVRAENLVHVMWPGGIR
jgi:transposase